MVTSPSSAIRLTISNLNFQWLLQGPPNQHLGNEFESTTPGSLCPFRQGWRRRVDCQRGSIGYPFYGGYCGCRGGKQPADREPEPEKCFPVTVTSTLVNDYFCVNDKGRFG